MYTEVGNTENRALSQPTALFSENVSQTEVDSMGLQDNKILSPFLAIRVLFCFLSPLVWGGPSFFFVSIFFFCSQQLPTYSAPTGDQKPKKKKKKINHNNNKIKQNRQPNSSEVHSYLLAGNRACSQGQKFGHSGATGTLHNQETRTWSATQPEAPHCSTQCEEVTTRRDTTHFIHLYFPLF